MVEALKRAEAGVPVEDLCRELEVSPAAFYRWRSKYGGLESSDLKRMKELEELLIGRQNCTRKSGEQFGNGVLGAHLLCDGCLQERESTSPPHPESVTAKKLPAVWP